MFIIICTLDGEAVLATSKQFDTIEAAQKYAATVDSGRMPIVLDLNDFN